MNKYSENFLHLENENHSLTKIFNLIADESVILDVGCGDGHLGHELIDKKNCIVHGIDIDQQSIEKAKENGFTSAKISDLDLDNINDLYNISFDYIIFADILEHLKHPRKLLTDSKELLSSEGKILISIPNIAHWSIRLELLNGHFDYEPLGILDVTHLKYWTKDSFLKLLNSCELYADFIDYTEYSFTEDILSKYGSGINTDLFNKPEAIAYQYIFTASPSNRKNTVTQLVKPLDEVNKVLNFAIKKSTDLENKLLEYDKNLKIAIDRFNKSRESLTNLEYLLNLEREKSIKNQQEINIYDTNLKAALEKSKNLEKEISTYDENLKIAIENLNKTKTEVETLQDMNKTKDEKIVSIDEEKNQLIRELSAFQVKIGNLNDDISGKIQKINNLNQQIKQSQVDLAKKEDLIPQVSILVICWNNKKFLEKCFDSIADQSYPNIETILIDNASEDDSISFTKDHYPWIRILELSKNFGFAEGNNFGMRLVLNERKSSYVFILNPDTELYPNCIEHLIERANEYYTFGSFSPKVKMMENPSLLNSAGGDCVFKCGDNLARAFYFENNNEDETISSVRDIFGMSGAGSFMRCDMLRQIGLYDASLFTYYEDVDLNYRIQLSGWKSLYVPEAEMLHYQGGTLNDFSPWKTYLLNRNKYYVLLKNLPSNLIWKYKVDILGSYLGLYKHLKQKKQLKIFINLTTYLVAHLIPILIKRRIIYKKFRPNKNISKYLDNLIIEHEEFMNPAVRAKSFEKYLEDLKARVA